MKRKTNKTNERKSATRIVFHYIVLLWPSIRLYYSMIVGYFKNKGKKQRKEKLEIIE